MVAPTRGRAWHALAQPHPLRPPPLRRPPSCHLLLLLLCSAAASPFWPAARGDTPPEQGSGAGQGEVPQLTHLKDGSLLLQPQRQVHLSPGNGTAVQEGAAWQDQASLVAGSRDNGNGGVAASSLPCKGSAPGVGWEATHAPASRWPYHPSPPLTQPAPGSAALQQNTSIAASVWGERRLLRRGPLVRRAQKIKVKVRVKGRVKVRVKVKVKVKGRKAPPKPKKRSPPPRSPAPSKPPSPLRQPITLPPPPSCPPLLPFPEDPKTGRMDKALLYPLCLLPEKGSRAIAMTVYRQSTGITFKGWGTTLGGMGARLGSLDAQSMDCLADLLFHSKRGLGLNIVRYNIPGGYNPQYSPLLSRDRLASQGFWPRPGVGKEPPRFNASADPFQRRFLCKARDKGVKVFEAIAYSPPWWMTRSNDTRGAARKGQTNLQPQHVDSFAQYLAAVISYLERSQGIRFSSLAPFNEPLEGWWTNGRRATHRTEGCNYSPADMDRLLPALQRALGGLPLSGVDSWMRATQAALHAPGSKGSLSVGTLRELSRINIHGYKTGPRVSPQGDSAAFLKLQRTLQGLKKPLWQTEWGPLGVSRGSDLEVALLMARQVVQHVSLLGAEAWLHWWAVQPENPFWGAVRIPWGSPGPLGAVFLSKQFYATAHFSRFLAPGCRILRLTNKCMHNVLAYYCPKAKAIGITVVNQRPRNSTLAVSVQGLKCSGGCSVDQYRTSKQESLKAVEMGAEVFPTTRLRILASSITTFVISKVPLYV